MLGHLGHDDCPEDLVGGGWKYRVGSSWFLDQNIQTRCVNKTRDQVHTVTVLNERLLCSSFEYLILGKIYIQYSCVLYYTIYQDIAIDVQEIKGKFTMKTMKMNENMRNPDSDEFKQLSSSIENGLMSILIEEENLDKQMDFQVTVEDIKVDDSQVNFKILYNMKDSFLAVPFELKPVNMSDVLHKDFKLRKGILFENFPVDSDSLECSGSDPCADCSHKCGYDYSRQGYVCTCPAPLQLDTDEKRCVQSGDDGKQETATVEGITDPEDTTGPFTTSTPPSTASSTLSTPCSRPGCRSRRTTITTSDETTTFRSTEDELEADKINDGEMLHTTSAAPGHVYHHVGFIHREQGGDKHDKYFPPIYGQSVNTPPMPDAAIRMTNSEGETSTKRICCSTKNSGSTKSSENVAARGTGVELETELDAPNQTTGSSPGLTSVPVTVSTDTSSKDSNIILPIIIDRFSPHHNHDEAKNRKNYHDDKESMRVMMTEDGRNLGVVEMKPVLSVKESSNSSSEDSVNNLPESVFMFDCIKAYNVNIDKDMTQEVLKCKMADKGDGEDVFIVVDTKILQKNNTP